MVLYNVGFNSFWCYDAATTTNKNQNEDHNVILTRFASLFNWRDRRKRYLILKKAYIVFLSKYVIYGRKKLFLRVFMYCRSIGLLQKRIPKLSMKTIKSKKASMLFGFTTINQRIVALHTTTPAKVDPNPNRRRLIVKEYGLKIVYIKGCKNIIADFLSCYPRLSNDPKPEINLLKQEADDQTFPLDFNVISKPQQTDKKRLDVVSKSKHYETRKLRQVPIIYYQN
jgi:hypothetical protein